MSDALSSNLTATSGKPMFTATRIGGAGGLVLAGFSIIVALVLMLTGSAVLTKGALTAGLLFNGVLAFFLGSYFLRGRTVERRMTAALILFVIAFASGIGIAIVAAKYAAYVMPVLFYALAYLVTCASFIWDLSDDR